MYIDNENKAVIYSEFTNQLQLLPYYIEKGNLLEEGYEVNLHVGVDAHYPGSDSEIHNKAQSSMFLCNVVLPTNYKIATLNTIIEVYAEYSEDLYEESMLLNCIINFLSSNYASTQYSTVEEVIKHIASTSSRNYDTTLNTINISITGMQRLNLMTKSADSLSDFKQLWNLSGNHYTTRIPRPLTIQVSGQYGIQSIQGSTNLTTSLVSPLGTGASSRNSNY